jgi:hypothetical protein
MLDKGLPLPAHCAPKEVPLGCALTPGLSGPLDPVVSLHGLVESLIEVGHG